MFFITSYNVLIDMNISTESENSSNNDSLILFNDLIDELKTDPFLLDDENLLNE